MIKTIFVPIAVNPTAVPFGMTPGQERDALKQAREYAEQTLNQLLDSGWRQQYADKVTDQAGLYFVFVLYKPDSPVAAKPLGDWLSDDPTVSAAAPTKRMARTLLIRPGRSTNC